MYMKWCSTSLIIIEIRIKSAMRYHLKFVRMAISKMTKITSDGKVVEKMEYLFAISGNINWYSRGNVNMPSGLLSGF